MDTLGIYVQVPFCQTRCTYCNFHTGVVSPGRFSPYVEAVCREIRGYRELYRAAGIGSESGEWRVTSGELEEGWALQENSGQASPPPRDRRLGLVDTVYFGGGTPSLLEAELLRKMMDAIRETFAAELSEVTLEADPETVEAGKAAAWVASGINRVSFGVQSFSDKELVAAGRMHRRADIYRASSILREAGIGN